MAERLYSLTKTLILHLHQRWGGRSVVFQFVVRQSKSLVNRGRECKNSFIPPVCLCSPVFSPDQSLRGRISSVWEKFNNPCAKARCADLQMSPQSLYWCFSLSPRTRFGFLSSQNPPHTDWGWGDRSQIPPPVLPPLSSRGRKKYGACVLRSRTPHKLALQDFEIS